MKVELQRRDDPCRAFKHGKHKPQRTHHCSIADMCDVTHHAFQVTQWSPDDLHKVLQLQHAAPMKLPQLLAGNPSTPLQSSLDLLHTGARDIAPAALAVVRATRELHPNKTLILLSDCRHINTLSCSSVSTELITCRDCQLVDAYARHTCCSNATLALTRSATRLQMLKLPGTSGYLLPAVPAVQAVPGPRPASWLWYSP